MSQPKPALTGGSSETESLAEPIEPVPQMSAVVATASVDSIKDFPSSINIPCLESKAARQYYRRATKQALRDVESGLASGTTVFVNGLRFRTDLNGRECTVLEGSSSAKRLRLLCDGEVLSVKKCNVEDGGSRRKRMEEQCARLSGAVVDAVEDDLVLWLLRAAVDAAAQRPEVKAVLDAQREAEEEEGRRQRQLADEAARRAGFADDGDRCYYKDQYLDMRRSYRRTRVASIHVTRIW
jgi:hypothetical protein